jgi:transposase-like protein
MRVRSTNCLDCGSTNTSKNGKQRGKQNYICKACRRQFIETYDPPSDYSDEFKRECLKMYVNGMGFRGIERVKGVHHTTVITWVKQIGDLLPDAYVCGVRIALLLPTLVMGQIL